MKKIYSAFLVDELCEVKRDRITRKYKNENINSYNRGYANGIDEAIKIVNEMPNADRMAYWMREDDNINEIQCTTVIVSCSFCGFTTTHNVRHISYRYCPNCGAKMNEE